MDPKHMIDDQGTRALFPWRDRVQMVSMLVCRGFERRYGNIRVGHKGVAGDGL